MTRCFIVIKTTLNIQSSRLEDNTGSVSIQNVFRLIYDKIFLQITNNGKRIINVRLSTICDNYGSQLCLRIGFHVYSFTIYRLALIILKINYKLTAVLNSAVKFIECLWFVLHRKLRNTSGGAVNTRGIRCEHGACFSRSSQN